MNQNYQKIKSALLSIAVSLLAPVLCIGCSDALIEEDTDTYALSSNEKIVSEEVDSSQSNVEMNTLKLETSAETETQIETAPETYLEPQTEPISETESVQPVSEPETTPPETEYVPILETTPETYAEIETEPEYIVETIPETAAKAEPEPQAESTTETAAETTAEIDIINGSSMTPELIEELVGIAVFWAPTGNKVHLDPDCRSFKLGVTYAGTLAEAESVRTNGWCGFCAKTGNNTGKYATEEVLSQCYTYEDYINHIPGYVFE